MGPLQTPGEAPIVTALGFMAYITFKVRSLFKRTQRSRAMTDPREPKLRVHSPRSSREDQERIHRGGNRETSALK